MKLGKENKPHIGIYGRCNSGKSTLLNSIVGHDCSIVAEHPGTTTDPVKVSFEILGFSPVIFIDTAGIDDNSKIGSLWVKRTLDSLEFIDLGIIVFREWGSIEEELKELFISKDIPFLLIKNTPSGASNFSGDFVHLDISIISMDDRDSLFLKIKELIPDKSLSGNKMFGNKIAEGDLVLLVCPQDSESPSGRLILPQVQAIRELMDKYAMALVVQPPQIPKVLQSGIMPKIVVTDSQLFGQIEKLIPRGTEITSFSILLAEMKGDMQTYNDGLPVLERLSEGDKILILENCRHQHTCEDIGRVKIPAAIEKYRGCRLKFEFISGLEPLPEDMSVFSMVLQCGGCMVTARQLRNRIASVKSQDIPITNYGMCLRYISEKNSR